MRFIILVEGHSEQKAVPAFLKRWLDPQLSKPVGVKAVRHDGWAELIKDSPTKARLHLQSSDVIAVIGLIDLYGPSICPPELSTAASRRDWLRAKIERDVNSARFHQFFAVHELEAWILSEPGILPNPIGESLPPSARYPETVNFDEPPKKLLSQLYREKLKRDYKVLTDGQELFRQLNPSECYQKCPHLRLLLDKMLELSKAAGL